MEKKSNKKIIFLTVLLGGLVIVLTIIIFLFVFNKDNINNENNIVEQQNIVKVNTNESINEVKILKGLTFESTKIVYQNGMSTLTTKVTNNDSVDYVKEKFKIIIKDKNNNVIVDLPGFIVGGLKANESKNIVSVVDIDLSSNAYYVEYEEV